MRYLVLTDIHGNLDALDAVLAAAGPVDDHLVLGDIVGYGAEPNGVIDRVRSLDPRLIIRGNHDKVASGVELPESFNPAALRAARWTNEALTPQNRGWLERLPAGPVIADDLVELCHGSPDDEDEYLFSAADARLAFAAMRRPVCLFGHTHVPACYSVLQEDLDEISIGATCGEDDAIDPAPAGKRRRRARRRGSRHLVSRPTVGCQAFASTVLTSRGAQLAAIHISRASTAPANRRPSCLRDAR